jgi:hypothetical protein
MSTYSIKKASEFTNDALFVSEYNKDQSNLDLMNSLDAEWSAIKTKATVNKTVAAQLTAIRSGGAKGDYMVNYAAILNPLAPEQITIPITIPTVTEESEFKTLTLLFNTNSSDPVIKRISIEHQEQVLKEVKEIMTELKIPNAYLIDSQSGVQVDPAKLAELPDQTNVEIKSHVQGG